MVRPLFFEWHRWLDTPLSAEMVRNLDHNHSRWESWMQQETEEETKTEMSDTEPADEPVSESVSESELRELLTVPAHSSRRHSAPVTLPTPVARTIIRRESLPAHPPRRLHTETVLHLQGAGALSVCSLASLRVPEEYEGESDVSAELLLPDPSITSITAGGTATPLSNWTPTPNRDGSTGSLASLTTPESPPAPQRPGARYDCRLERQRTFPLTEPAGASRVRYLSLPVAPAAPGGGCRGGHGCGTPPSSPGEMKGQLCALQPALADRVAAQRPRPGRRRAEPAADLAEESQPLAAGWRGGAARLGVLLRRRDSAPVRLGCCAQEARAAGSIARNSSFTEGK